MGSGVFRLDIQRSGFVGPEGLSFLRHKCYSNFLDSYQIWTFRRLQAGGKATRSRSLPRERWVPVSGGRQAPGGAAPAYGAVSGYGSCWRQSIRVLRPDRFPRGGGFSGDCWRPGHRLSEVSGPGPKSVIFHPGGYWGVRTGSLVSFRGVLGMSLPADQSGPAHARQSAFRESNATNEKGQALGLPLLGELGVAYRCQGVGLNRCCYPGSLGQCYSRTLGHAERW